MPTPALEIGGIRQPESLEGFRQDLTTALVEYQTPADFTAARTQALALPGMQNYLDITQGNEEKALSEMTTDILERARSLSEIGWVGYLTGMSDAEKQETFSTPERKPYETLLEEPMDRVALLKQYLTIGSYLVKDYQDALDDQERAPAGPKKETAKKRVNNTKKHLRTFEEHSIHPIFGPLMDDLNDRLWGIDPKMRKAGTITGPDQRVTQLIAQIADEVAMTEGNNAKEVEEAIYNITKGGDVQLAMRPLLHGYAGEPYLRRALISLFERTTGDRTLTEEKIKNVWLIELYLRKLGSSLNIGYELNGLPPADEAEARINAFTRNPQELLEVWRHIRRDAPTTFAKALKQLPEAARQKLIDQDIDSPDELIDATQIDYEDLVLEINQRLGLPGRLPTDEEIEARQSDLGEKWQEVMPSAGFKEEASSKEISAVWMPKGIGSSRRQFNCHYRSGNRDESHTVSDSILNPYEEDERYWRGQAHELTHKTHDVMLHKGEHTRDAKGELYLQPGSGNAVAHSIRETLAMLVDNAALRYYKTVVKKTPPQSGKYPDTKYALTIRVQGMYGLGQLWTRQRINEFIDADSAVPTVDAVAAIYDDIAPRLRKAHEDGINIKHYRSVLATNLWEYGRYDGINYISNDLKIDTETDGPQINPIRRAFEKQFGEDWLWGEKAKEARAVLLCLYVETGKHPQGTDEDIEQLAQFVQTTKPEAALEKLQALGIADEYI